MEAGTLGAASSHLAAFSGIPVLASDGGPVGTLMHVLSSGPVQILDGIVIESRVGGGGARFVDAALVSGFFERGVTLALDREACAALPRPQPAPPVAEAAHDPTALDVKLRRAWDVLAGERS